MEEKTYIIPLNYKNKLLKRLPNFIEAAIMAFIEYKLLHMIPFVSTVQFTVDIIVIGATVLLFIAGIRDESVFQYLFQIIRFLMGSKKYKMRRIGYNGYGRTKETVKRTEAREKELKEIAIREKKASKKKRR